MKKLLPLSLLALSFPAFAGEITDIKGWMADQSKAMAASPEIVLATAADLTTWKEWTAWSAKADPEAKWTYTGEANTVGHGMSWDGPELGQGTMTITEVSDQGYKFDLLFGKSKKVNKGRITVKPTDKGSDVQWVTAGPMGPLGRLFFKRKVSKMLGADFETGLSNLKPLVEAEQAAATKLADAKAKADSLTKAAAEADAKVTQANVRVDAAQAKVDAANADLGKAKGKAKAAAQAAMDEATKAATETRADAKAAEMAAKQAGAAAKAAADELAALEAAK
jgi:Polyketide cyclase / dehydrase and lipid transport